MTAGLYRTIRDDVLGIFNAAWAHLFFADTNLVQQSATAGVIQGNYSGSQADLLTFDLSYKF